MHNFTLLHVRVLGRSIKVCGDVFFKIITYPLQALQKSRVAVHVCIHPSRNSGYISTHFSRNLFSSYLQSTQVCISKIMHKSTSDQVPLKSIILICVEKILETKTCGHYFHRYPWYVKLAQRFIGLHRANFQDVLWKLRVITQLVHRHIHTKRRN